MKRVEELQNDLAALTKALQEHKLYEHLNDLDDIKVFMENHVFAVWDFMSLLKYLQQRLTHVEIPWFPPKNPKLSRFINEIVYGEESDINELGEVKSHFQMYLDAMQQLGASTLKIDHFIDLLQSGYTMEYALGHCGVNKGVADFVRFTFSIIHTKKPHIVASAFTFGREDLIPELFIEILRKTDSKQHSLRKFEYYLQRHIELDGDEHGPLSLLMIEELCGDDDQKWIEATAVAKQAIQQRIRLWDAVSLEITLKKKDLCRVYL
ncbi:DUF3050 domain-containing protein [Aureitalea marina]|uniref:Heme oxygenase n=1 Tax=Aureitalea marina TaxID=930804 RepID=A0A2S7KR41_9FLAO|nr:DUF3050 domain-containing protein [Aureitalea marina]PQB05091.1 heme oxygenase [Aureitalea marina]